MTVNNDNFITELSTMTDFNKSKFIRAIEDENIYPADKIRHARTG